MIIFRASRMYFANEGMSRNYDLSICNRGVHHKNFQGANLCEVV